MRNPVILAFLMVILVMTAGCTNLSGPQQVHAGIPHSTGTPAVPDLRPETPGNESGTAAGECIERTGGATSYPMNITRANEHPLSRQEFMDVNREYLAFLAKEIGQENAEQMLNDRYTRSMGSSLQDPSSGNDTIISIRVDPAGVHAAGRTFEITGTTNLPPGRELTLVIFAGNYDRAILPCEDPWHNPVKRTAVVKAGGQSGNTWSYTLNTTGFASDDYLIYVRETGKENAFLTSSLFHLY